MHNAHFKYVVVAEMVNERRALALKRARVAMLSASEEERAEKLGLTSPLSQRTCSQGSQNGDHELYEWLLDADLNLPMLLCVDGEIEQLESTADVQRDLFEKNNVDIYKTPAKLSGDTQANGRARGLKSHFVALRYRCGVWRCTRCVDGGH